jgi:antitoxin VapB
MASRQKHGELRAKIFKNGRSQAIRLPKELRFDDDQVEVRVRKEGHKLVIEPLDEWSEAFLSTEGSVPDAPTPPRRTPLGRARDRFER